MRLLIPALALAASLGCANKVDRLTIDKVYTRGVQVPDLGLVCGTGVGLRHALGAVTTKADRAMLIAEASAGLCAEIDAYEAALEVVRSKRNHPSDRRSAEMRDARFKEQRLHAEAAGRFYRAWLHAETHWGELGEGCPKIAKKDESTYLLAMYAGLNAVLHDKAGGSKVGVPLDLIAKAGRGATCLDDADWWNAPSAMQNGAWATIPGSGPDGHDPWAEIDRLATEGAASGVRLALGIQVKMGANAGEDELVIAGIQEMAESLEQVPVNPEWAFFDLYAARVILHESDLIWLDEEGHRTPNLGEMPVEEEPPGPDPLGGDPFGGDPFGGDPFGGGSPEPSLDETPEQE